MAYLVYCSQPSWEGGKARSWLNSPQVTGMPPLAKVNVIPLVESSPDSGLMFWRTPIDHGSTCVSTQRREHEHSHAEKARARTGENGEGAVGAT